MSTDECSKLAWAAGRTKARRRREILRAALALLLLAAMVSLDGCARRYVVRLSRGVTLTSKGKPRLDKTIDCYVFKDTKGRQVVVPAISVSEIAPASMASDSATLPPVRNYPGR